MRRLFHDRILNWSKYNRLESTSLVTPGSRILASVSRRLVFVWVVCVANTLFAADPVPADLQKIVANSVKQYVDAFSKRDAKALAALFTAEAEYIDAAGTVFHGRKTIEAELKSSFDQDPAGTLAIEVTSIRPVGPGLLVEEGVSTFTPKEKEATAGRTRYTTTHVKQADGTWLIASVRELETAELSPHEQLKALAWLEGRWREEIGTDVVRSVWKWADGGNFLVSEFSVASSGQPATKGVHRIGWDPERNQFRSWIFDAAGGHTDGWWTPASDGSWSVQLSGVSASGVRRSSLVTYAKDGANAIVVTQEKHIQAGITLPDSSHRVVREAPEPIAAPAPVKR
ncbi:MAG: SnoaL-like domain protein [Schlesneria sp.]|nr:SnoaL-like domain protein [Schlesneria sp.]